jgi:hypothetical protein
MAESFVYKRLNRFWGAEKILKGDTFHVFKPFKESIKRNIAFNKAADLRSNPVVCYEADYDVVVV